MRPGFLVLVAACSSTPTRTTSCPSADTLLAESAHAYRDGHLFLARTRAVAADRQCSTSQTRAAIAAIDSELVGSASTVSDPTRAAIAAEARWLGDTKAAAAALRGAGDPDRLAELGRVELARGNGAAGQRALEQAVARAEKRAGKHGEWQWPTFNRDRVAQIRVTGDGSRIVTADTDGRVTIWDRASLRAVRELELAQFPRWLEISPNGKWVATGGNHPMPTRVHDLATGEVIVEFPPNENGAVAFTDTNHLLIAETADVLEVELPSKTEVARLPTTKQLAQLAFADHKIIGAESSSGRVIIWDAITHEAIREHDAGGQISELHAAANGKLASLIDGGILLHDLEGKKQPLIVGRFYQLAISEDGKLIATTTYDGKLVLYNATTRDIIRTVAARRNNDALHFHHDFLFAGGYDAADIWKLDDGKHVASFQDTPTWASALAFDARGEKLAVGSGAGWVTVWSLASGAASTRIVRPGEIVRHVAWAPDGDLAAASDAFNQRTLNNTVIVWNAAGEKLWWAELDRLQWFGYRPGTSTLSTAALVVGSDGQSYQLQLWSDRGKPLQSKPLESTRAYHWTRDGKAFVGSTGNELVTMPLDDGKTTKQPLQHYSSSLDPSGALLATTVDDGKVAFWDLARNEPTRVVFDELGSPNAMAWSPSGNVFISAAADTASVWDPKTGARLAQLEGPSTIVSAAVRPDGAVVATGHVDGRVILWSMETATPIATLHAPDELTAYVTTPDGAIDGTLPDDVLAWKVGDTVLPGRGVFDRQRVPGLLASRLAKVSHQTAPAPGVAGAAPPPPPPACYRESERGQRSLRTSLVSEDGKTLRMCLEYNYIVRNTTNVRPPHMCFDVDLARGKYTPRTPTAREALGLWDPGPTVVGDHGVAHVCKAGACTDVRVYEPADELLRFVVDDDARLLATAWRVSDGREAVFTYDVRTGKRLSQFIAKSHSPDYTFLDETLLVSGSSRPHFIDPKKGREIARVAADSSATPAKVAQNVWAFNDTRKPDVYLQNVKTGRVVGRFKMPKAACTNDPDATWLSCDSVTLLSAESRILALPGVRPGDVMIFDQRGKLLADHHLPICPAQ